MPDDLEANEFLFPGIPIPDPMPEHEAIEGIAVMVEQARD